MRSEIKFPSPSDDNGCLVDLFAALVLTLAMIVRHPGRLRDAWRGAS